MHHDFKTDFRCDITGLGKLEGTQLTEILALEEQIRKIGTKIAPTPVPQTPTWTNIPMTPVDSSFVMGVGAYKGKLLLEFHHDPGNIWGFDVNSQGSQFFTELMMAGSKGGWVWDKILGKPSEFGMAKGKFFAYQDKNGKMNYYTTPGAQFVHKYGRPTKFTYNPVGYLNSKTQYEITSKFGKEWKESLVRPSESRLPAEMKLLEQKQQKEKIEELRAGFERLQAIEGLRPLFEKQQKAKSFQELMSELDRLQKFDELQRALKKRGIKKDLIHDILEKILESQLTLTPTIVPIIEEVHDLSMSQGRNAFDKRSNRAKSMDKRIRAKTVYPEVTEEWLERPNYTDVEGIDTSEGKNGEKKPEKLKIQGYYSAEMIMGKLSDLEAIKQKYPLNMAIKMRIERLEDLFNRLKNITSPDLVDQIEKEIKEGLNFLNENIDQIETSRDKEIEGAKIIGELLGSVKDLKKHEGDIEVQKALSALRALERKYATGGISIGAFKLVAKLSRDKIQKHIADKTSLDRSKRSDWANLDEEAVREIKQYDKERSQERKNRIIYAQDSIKYEGERIKELKKQLRKVDPDTGMMWESLPEGGSTGTNKSDIEYELKKVKESFNQAKTMLETTRNLNMIDPPGKFEFHDKNFRLAGRSKYKKENLEWLGKIKKEYLKIPARFRDSNSARVLFVNKTSTGWGRKSTTAGGTYSPAAKRVNIATNPKVRRGFSGGSVIAHEMGHNVWYEKLNTFQKRKFTEIWRKYSGKMRKTGDDYAATSDIEGFAEAFQEYATGQIWYGREWHNKERIGEALYPTESGKERGIMKIPTSANYKTWGMLDDFPEMRDFFNKHLGPNKSLEVNS